MQDTTGQIEELFIKQLLLTNKAIQEHLYGDKEYKEVDPEVSILLDYGSNYIELYTEEKFKDFLDERGFNIYEAESFVQLIQSRQITSSTLDFFRNLDLSTEGNYQSPLSQDNNWLATPIVYEDRLAQYADLISYITQSYQRHETAEFLAIFDLFVENNQGNPILQALKDFAQHKDNAPYSYNCMDWLSDELNKFTKRYIVDEFGEVSKDYDPVFIFDGKGGLKFRRAGKSQSDAVIELPNGELLLLAATSNEDTDSQNQIFRMTEGLEKKIGKKVSCVIYCEALITRKSVLNSKSALRYQEVSDGLIDAINLLAGFQAFSVSDINNMELYKKVLDRHGIQFYDHGAGQKTKGLSAKEKVSVLESAMDTVLSEFNNNRKYWLGNGTAKDLPKKVMLNLCNTFLWFNTNELITSESLKQKARECLDGYSFPLAANITGREGSLLAQTKKALGLSVSKLSL